MAKLNGITGDEGSWNAIVTPLWGVGGRGERGGGGRGEGEEEKGTRKRGVEALTLYSVMLFIS